MGMLIFIYAIPALSLALVAGAVASHRLSSGLRRASILAAIVLACAVVRSCVPAASPACCFEFPLAVDQDARERLLARPATSQWRSRPLRQPRRRPTSSLTQPAIRRQL
jgi:hypothetical protein